MALKSAMSKENMTPENGMLLYNPVEIFTIASGATALVYSGVQYAATRRRISPRIER